MNMLISTNMASTRLTKRTKDVDKSENKALAYTEEIVQGIHITEENIREAKKIEHSDRKSAMFVINQAAGQQSTLPRNASKHTKGFASKLYTQQSKISPPNSTAASLFSTKDLKELTILLLLPDPTPNSLY
jgi:hypothetical protein